MLLPRLDDIPAHFVALLACIAVTLLAAAIPDSAAAGGETPPFVPGEVMVKFRAGTAASSAVSRSAQAAPPSLEPLTPSARLLTEKSGIPLRAKQLLSGDWVVFVVDLDELAAQALAHLKKQDDVSDAGVKAGERGGVNQPAVPDLEVSFRPGSSAAKLIEEGAAGERVGALVGDLAKRLGLPLAGAVEAKRLRLRIDLQKLTALLPERLGSVGDIVESAELNYVMRAM